MLIVDIDCRTYAIKKLDTSLFEVLMVNQDGTLATIGFLDEIRRLPLNLLFQRIQTMTP